MVFCLRRLPSVPAPEFHEYWRGRHAALFAEVAGVLGVRRYTQLHTVDHPINQALRATRGGEEAYDGVAQVWWDDLETLLGYLRSEAGRAAAARLIEDERHFVDLAHSAIWMAEEEIIELR
jgi:uncharacterized protein (TIGR02118 family)